MIRISVTGPESTGKSWLAERLAEHYHAEWMPEYARKYLESIKRPYTFHDILLISQKQFEMEESYRESTRFLFCDTDFCVTTIWCNVKYGECHPWITEKLKQNIYGLYLLCDVDLPWEHDPLREHPEMRAELFQMYESLLKGNKFNYQIINGAGEIRLQNAISAIDAFLYSTQNELFI
jgi:NadR type nicotinamide-nucleotide adenylyltransferase